MNRRKLIKFLFYGFEFLLCLNKICNCQNDIPHNSHQDLSRNNDHLISICLKVSNSLIYYEELLKNYEYDNSCLKYNKIGNSILEKYNLNDYNCYRKIQKALCKLRYIDTRNNVIEDKNGNVESEHKEDMGEKSANKILHQSSGKKIYNISKSNAHNSKIEKCDKTKFFFISLIKRCIEKGDKDPLVHCASLNYEKKIILDGKLFCQSSYERNRVEENQIRKSIYGNNYKKVAIETLSFKNDEMDYCMHMVNMFNNCSIVEKNLFNTTISSCIHERSKNFCHIIIEKVDDTNYIYTCSDIILPYLLSSQEENSTYDNLCNNIGNYLHILKKKKNSYLKEIRNITEKAKNMKITLKISKMLEKAFKLLKKEIKEDGLEVHNLFVNLEKLKDKNVLPNQYMLKLNEIYEQIQQYENIIHQFGKFITDSNYIEKNDSLLDKIKVNVNMLITLQKHVSANSKLINEYINNNLSENLKEKNVKLSFEELKKMEKKYDHVVNLVERYAEKNVKYAIEHKKLLEQNLLNDYTNIRSLSDIYTDQISLLIKNNILPAEK